MDAFTCCVDVPSLVTVSSKLTGWPGAAVAENAPLLNASVCPVRAADWYDFANWTALYASTSPAPCWSAGASMSSDVLVRMVLISAGVGEAPPWPSR